MHGHIPTPRADSPLSRTMLAVHGLTQRVRERLCSLETPVEGRDEHEVNVRHGRGRVREEGAELVGLVEAAVGELGRQCSW